MPVSMAWTFVGAVAVDRRPRGRHLAGEVAARHRRLGRDALARLRLVDRGREDAAAHRPRAADVADERARVDPGDPGDAGVAQPVQPAALGGRGVLGVVALAHDHAARPHAVGLHRRRADAVVADVRGGEGQDLAGEGRVGDGLLVAAHAGREDDLARGRDAVERRRAGLAVEARPVLEQDVGVGAAGRVPVVIRPPPRRRARARRPRRRRP